MITTPPPRLIGVGLVSQDPNHRWVLTGYTGAYGAGTALEKVNRKGHREKENCRDTVEKKRMQAMRR